MTNKLPNYSKYSDRGVLQLWSQKREVPQNSGQSINNTARYSTITNFRRSPLSTILIGRVHLQEESANTPWMHDMPAHLKLNQRLDDRLLQEGLLQHHYPSNRTMVFRRGDQDQEPM